MLCYTFFFLKLALFTAAVASLVLRQIPNMCNIIIGVENKIDSDSDSEKHILRVRLMRWVWALLRREIT